MATSRLWYVGSTQRFSYISKYTSSHLLLKDSSVVHLWPRIVSSGTSNRHLSWTGFYSSVSQSAPVITIQESLIELHQWSNLPWWGIIVLSTFSIRSILLPLAIHQQQVISRLANLRVELSQLAPELNKEVNMAKVMYKWDEPTAKRVFKRQMRELNRKRIIRDNCHPFKTFLLVIFQVPVWVCFSVSLRNLTLMSCEANPVLQLLKTEGILWFSNLTTPDAFIIPLMLVTVNLALIEMHALRQIGKGNLLQKILLNSSRIITLVVGVAATFNPSSVTLYWLCSSSFGLAQSILLMLPKVRRFVRIPPMLHDSATPFRDITANLRKQLQRH